MFIGFREAAKLGCNYWTKKKKEGRKICRQPAIIDMRRRQSLEYNLSDVIYQPPASYDFYRKKKDEKKKQTKQRTIITHKEKQSDGFECPHSNQTIEETIPGQQYTTVWLLYVFRVGTKR